MTVISRRTEAAIVRVLANMSHAYLDALAYEFGVEDLSGGYTREQKALSIIKAISKTADSDAARAQHLLDIATRLLTEPRAQSILDGGEVSALITSLQLDGYEQSDGRIAPKFPGPVAPSEPISWLEQRLKDLGMIVAATHFRQAVENFEKGNWEACNGQLRSFAEDFFRRAATILYGKEFEDPSSAIQHLVQKGAIDQNENQMAKALWASLQDNGAHAGLSHHDEALFRLHTVAAFSQYLMARGLLGAS